MRQSLIEITPPVAAGGVLFLLTKNWIMPSDGPEILLGTFIATLSTWGCFRILGRKWTKSRLCSAVVFGVLLFTLSQSVSDFIDSAVWSGVDPKRVSLAHIVLTSDPVLLGTGRWIAEGRLVSVESENIRAEAKGSIVIYGKGSMPETGFGGMVWVRGIMTRSRMPRREAPFHFSAVETIPGDWTAGLFAAREAFIRRISMGIDRAEADTASFLSALLLGRKTDTGSNLMRWFKDAGCMHLLALSGFHVGLIALALRFLTKPLLGHRAASCLSALGAVSYLVLAGFRPSLVRAVLMYLFWTVDTLRHRKISPWAYLSAAFLVQGLFCPKAMASISFQLSYAALAGLLGPGTAWMRILNRRVPLLISGPLGAGMGAQAATLPLVCGTFGIWRPIGLLASPLLTPMVAWTMGVGFLALVFGERHVGALSYLVLHGMCTGMETVAGEFSRVPGIVLPTPVPWLAAGLGTIIPFILIRNSSRKTIPD